jgi:MarR family transcriptional repressor of emrRAB
MPPEIPVRADRALELVYPEVDSRASDCIINIWRTHAMLAEVMARLLRPHDLTLTGFRVILMTRIAGGSMSPAEIADRLGSSRATVTGVLDSLEKRGFVRRTADTEDRRRLQVTVTPEGRAILEGILPTFFTRERESVAHLDAADQETLVELLGGMQRSILAMLDSDA